MREHIGRRRRRGKPTPHTHKPYAESDPASWAMILGHLSLLPGTQPLVVTRLCSKAPEGSAGGELETLDAGEGCQ
jgi:hypothetical protein